MMSNPYDFVDWLKKKDSLTQRRIILRTIYVVLYELVLVVVFPVIFLQHSSFLALAWLVATIGYIVKRHTYLKGRGKEYLPYKPDMDVDDDEWGEL